MFDVIDYFVSGKVYESYSYLLVFFIYMSIMVCFSFFILVRTYLLLKKTKNDANIYLLRTMIGILFWNLGEWILTIVQLLSNENWGIFSGVNNIPLAIGLVLTVNSFFSYMQINLKINKYKQRRRLFNQKIFSTIKLLSLITLYLFILRFLALPFMSEVGIDESFDIIIFILVGLSLLILILMFILFLQMIREKKVLSSKLDRIRINFYLIFLIFTLLAIVNVWLFLLSYLISDLKDLSNIIIFLIYLPSLLALFFLYYGVFLPTWVQKRLGLLPSF